MASDSDSEDYSFQNEEMSQNSLDSSHNMANVTFVGEDDQPLDFNALPQDENSPEFNWAAAQALKKNLNVTFEKHVDQAFNVKAKIQAFENKSKISSSKYSQDGRRELQQGNQSLPTSRPPTVPIVSSSKKVNGSLLSVYLRLRPPTASKEAVEKEEDALDNTIEVISISNNEPCTRIRTYPPVYSNASKVVRSKFQLHSQSSNKDLIFDESSTASNSALDCAVKGVKEFDFDQVFDQTAKQIEVYRQVAFPLVEGMFPKDNANHSDNIVGESALLFSYGITNAGKTHTIMGKKSHSTSLDENHGIIPRSIDHILTRIKRMDSDVEKRAKYALYLSYLEIYNEQIYDLLPNKRPMGVDIGAENSLKLREGRSGKIYAKGLTKHLVTTLEEGLRLCEEAKKRRHTSSNNINSDSSRSHSICQFELIAIPSEVATHFDNESIATATSEYGIDNDSVVSNTSTKKSVTLWVVDLAGSERSKRTGNFSRSMRQKEASLINSSLMKLMRCLQTLRDNQISSTTTTVVPFRESKLTHLFMGHLTGSSASRTSMIVNVNPAAADFDETQHVLSYATVAKTVRIDKAEFCKVRKQIQKGCSKSSRHTHDDNGRRIGQTASPPRKLSKLVEKISPRAILARRKGNREAEVKKENESASILGQQKKHLIGSKRKLEDENFQLNAALEAAIKECKKYSDEVEFLRCKIETCESAIRNELSKDMENQIRFAQMQHDEIVRRLKQQIHASQSVSQSAKKARLDKAEEIIEQYMDKVDECEEEIDRLKQEHDEAVSNLKRDFLRKLNEKDIEIQSLKIEIEEKDEEIAKLREELNLSDSSDGIVSKESIDSDVLDEGLDSPTLYEKTNTAPSATPSSATPQTRRLPRRRCSEVACTNVSPTKDEPVSSSKKRGLKLATSKFNALQKLASPPLKHSTIEDDIMFPNSQPEFDEDRQLYIRPRGRAPTGRRWDAKRGGWKTIS